MVYRNFSGYLREKYHKTIKKICIDGGFTCPNRDGTCGYGGCIFCGERGAGEHIDASCVSISEQVEKAIKSNPKVDAFIAYFQNFTNTYAPVDILKKKYDSALIDDRIIALAVGTRPDCINEDVVKLLRGYAEKYDVWVELGLQTSDDDTAKIINRGYPSNTFSTAVKILHEYGIKTVVHLIIGLPGERFKHVRETVGFINRFNLWGVKIHSIYVMKGTKLEKMYLDGEYTPPTLEEYVEAATYVLCHISPDMIVHRLTGDCPRDLLVAPDWNKDKNNIINQINQRMISNGWNQGCLFKVE